MEYHFTLCNERMKCLIDKRSQRRMARLAQTDRRATVSQTARLYNRSGKKKNRKENMVKCGRFTFESTSGGVITISLKYLNNNFLI